MMIRKLSFAWRGSDLLMRAVRIAALGTVLLALVVPPAHGQEASDAAADDGPAITAESAAQPAAEPAALTASDAVAGDGAAPVATDSTGIENTPASTQQIERWPYFSAIDVPAFNKAHTVFDFLVTPPVFDKARVDLGDLRLIDAAGHEVPYALRIRQPVFVDEPVGASEFNRAVGPNGAAEVTLDLGANPVEHNSLDVTLPGTNYRRIAHLEGSNDNENWKTLVDKASLVHFQAGTREFDQRRVSYSPSRYRYLRLRVDRDPELDDKPVEVGPVTVHRKVEAPGELITLDATLGPREPVSVDGNPGSAWFIDLGAENMPCQQLLVAVGDAEFARDWRVQKANVPDEYPPFFQLGSGQWKRRAGERREPMVANFSETTARRLRLEVVDYRNPPLDIKSVQFVAAAREVIFARTENLQSPLRLYYGNSDAEPPHYDIERNLPAQFEVPPERVTLGPREANPTFRPAPLPLTERLPWLIYIVLGVASLALGLVIVNLGRTAIARHDAQ